MSVVVHRREKNRHRSHALPREPMRTNMPSVAFPGRWWRSTYSTRSFIPWESDCFDDTWRFG
jgi:hypothetical protein